MENLESLAGHPFSPHIIIEDKPQIYKKRYFKGCLNGVKGAKLLIQRYGGIGDIQWVMPSLRELKLRHPDCIIRFACFEKDREIIYNCPFINEMTTTHFPVAKDLLWADFILDFFDTVEGIGTEEAKWRNPIDINEEIIGYKIKDKSTWYKVEPFEERQAETILASKGIKEDDILIGFPLVASSPHRSWNNQAEVIKLLLDYSEKVKCIVFAKEGVFEPILSKIIDLNSNRVVNMSGKTTVRQLFVFLSKCNVIFSNDTGAVHVMASLKKKIVAIFTTVPKETRISTYPTVVGIQAKTDCSPCWKLSEPCNHGDKCLNSIKATDVVKEIIKLI